MERRDFTPNQIRVLTLMVEHAEQHGRESWYLVPNRTRRNLINMGLLETPKDRCKGLGVHERCRLNDVGWETIQRILKENAT